MQAQPHRTCSLIGGAEIDMVAMSRILSLEMSLGVLLSMPDLRPREEIDHHTKTKSNNPVNVNDIKPEELLRLILRVKNHKDLGHDFSLLGTICVNAWLKFTFSRFN